MGTEVVWRSVAVGVVATLADLGALWALIGGLGVSPAVANVPALVLGLLVQFTGNKWFAFQDRSRALVRQGGLFLLVEAGAFALNAGAFHLLTGAGVPWLPARALGASGVYLGFSLPLWGRIFRLPARRNIGRPAPRCASVGARRAGGTETTS